MLSIVSVKQGKKNIGHHQLVICDQCGQYGHYEVIMTFVYLNFIIFPLFKWKKRYFVKTSCCNSLYQLNHKIGRKIARGAEMEIVPRDLILLQKGTSKKQMTDGSKFCIRCGFTTMEPDYAYCPKCGKELETGRNAMEAHSIQ